MSDKPVDVEALIHKLTSGRNNNSLVETVGGVQHYYSCLEAVDALRQQQAEIERLQRAVDEAQQNSAFFRSCALSGEVPVIEPFPKLAKGE